MAAKLAYWPGQPEADAAFIGGQDTGTDSQHNTGEHARTGDQRHRGLAILTGATRFAKNFPNGKNGAPGEGRCKQAARMQKVALTCLMSSRRVRGILLAQRGGQILRRLPRTISQQWPTLHQTLDDHRDFGVTPLQPTM